MLWVIGIDQNRDQAPLFIGRARVDAPCPEGVRSPIARIGPGSRDIIVVPRKAPGGFTCFMPNRSNYSGNLSSMTLYPPDLVRLIENERHHQGDCCANQEKLDHTSISCITTCACDDAAQDITFKNCLDGYIISEIMQ